MFVNIRFPADLAVFSDKMCILGSCSLRQLRVYVFMSFQSNQ